MGESQAAAGGGPERDGPQGRGRGAVYEAVTGTTEQREGELLPHTGKLLSATAWFP